MATPCVLGNECAGTLVAIGSNVKPEEYGYKIGDKVAVSNRQHKLKVLQNLFTIRRLMVLEAVTLNTPVQPQRMRLKFLHILPPVRRPLP